MLLVTAVQASEPPPHCGTALAETYTEQGYPTGLREAPESAPRDERESLPSSPEDFYRQWCGDGTCHDPEEYQKEAASF